MKPLLWAVAGGAAVGVVLATRRAQAQTKPSSTTQTYGEIVRVPLAVPDGWRRVTSSEVAALPELGIAANALRNMPGFTSLPYGTIAPFIGSDGRMYATWVEQHYHEPGGPVQPWGLHHGVTLLTAA